MYIESSIDWFGFCFSFFFPLCLFSLDLPPPSLSSSGWGFTKGRLYRPRGRTGVSWRAGGFRLTGCGEQWEKNKKYFVLIDAVFDFSSLEGAVDTSIDTNGICDVPFTGR